MSAYCGKVLCTLTGSFDHFPFLPSQNRHYHLLSQMRKVRLRGGKTSGASWIQNGESEYTSVFVDLKLMLCPPRPHSPTLPGQDAFLIPTAPTLPALSSKRYRQRHLPQVTVAQRPKTLDSHLHFRLFTLGLELILTYLVISLPILPPIRKDIRIQIIFDRSKK